MLILTHLISCATAVFSPMHYGRNRHSDQWALQCQSSSLDSNVFLYRKLLVHTLLLQCVEGRIHNESTRHQRRSDRNVFWDLLLLRFLSRLGQSLPPKNSYHISPGARTRCSYFNSWRNIYVSLMALTVLCVTLPGVLLPGCRSSVVQCCVYGVSDHIWIPLLPLRRCLLRT